MVRGRAARDRGRVPAAHRRDRRRGAEVGGRDRQRRAAADRARRPRRLAPRLRRRRAARARELLRFDCFQEDPHYHYVSWRERRRTRCCTSIRWPTATRCAGRSSASARGCRRCSTRAGVAAKLAARVDAASRVRRRVAAARRARGGAARAPWPTREVSVLGIGSRATHAAVLRERLGHPVVDADGHYIETGPVLKEFVREYVRERGGARLDAALRARPAASTTTRPCCGPGADSPMPSAARAGRRGRRGGACPPRTASTARRRICRACSPSASATSASTSRCSIRAACSRRTAIRDAEVRQVACRALNAFAPRSTRPTPIA